MSKFLGKMEEIPEIRIDRYDNDNLNSKAYFLSHCHSDHMEGLHVSNFFQELENNKKYFYASEISCRIVEEKYSLTPAQKSYLKPLAPYLRTSISLDTETISVISIPTNHCPGALMFLFEKNEKRQSTVLYTGDYRIYKKDIDQFYNNLNRDVTIDKIYLDTTFFSKRYPWFPTREQSIEEICNKIQNIFEKDAESHIHLRTGAYYGYERCFQAIYKKFKEPVHINKKCYDEVYHCVPALDNCVTLEASKARIHVHCGGYTQICSIYSKLHEIDITATFWTEEMFTKYGFSTSEKFTKYYYLTPEKQALRVCFATHASYEEGVAFLMLLKPKDIIPCVEGKNANLNKDLHDLIQDTLYKIKDNSLVTPDKTKADTILPSTSQSNGTISNSTPLNDDKNNSLIINNPAKRKLDFGNGTKEEERDDGQKPPKNIMLNDQGII